MAHHKTETASFLLRFTQKVFQDDEGEHEVQWRGSVSHVQGGDEQRFSNFDEATQFIQDKLTELTLQAIEDKSPEEQKGILAKSFSLWKKMALDGPKLVRETIKDPMKQVAQIQHQISQVGDSIGKRIEDRIGQVVEIDDWRGASKTDLKHLVDAIEKMSDQIAALNSKVDKLKK
jgi:hypothetical protein